LKLYENSFFNTNVAIECRSVRRFLSNPFDKVC